MSTGPGQKKCATIQKVRTKQIPKINPKAPGRSFRHNWYPAHRRMPAFSSQPRKIDSQ